MPVLGPRQLSVQAFTPLQEPARGPHIYARAPHIPRQICTSHPGYTAQPVSLASRHATPTPAVTRINAPPPPPSSGNVSRHATPLRRPLPSFVGPQPAHFATAADSTAPSRCETPSTPAITRSSASFKGLHSSGGTPPPPLAPRLPCGRSTPSLPRTESTQSMSYERYMGNSTPHGADMETSSELRLRASVFRQGSGSSSDGFAETNMSKNTVLPVGAMTFGAFGGSFVAPPGKPSDIAPSITLQESCSSVDKVSAQSLRHRLFVGQEDESVDDGRKHQLHADAKVDLDSTDASATTIDTAASTEDSSSGDERSVVAANVVETAMSETVPCDEVMEVLLQLEQMELQLVKEREDKTEIIETHERKMKDVQEAHDKHMAALQATLRAVLAEKYGLVASVAKLEMKLPLRKLQNCHSKVSRKRGKDDASSSAGSDTCDTASDRPGSPTGTSSDSASCDEGISIRADASSSEGEGAEILCPLVIKRQTEVLAC